MRHLFTGQNLRKLLSSPRRIFSRDHPQSNIVRICQYCTQHGNSLRLVIFNADQHLAGL